MQKGEAAAALEADDAEDIEEDESGWETASDEGDAVAAARGDNDASTSQVCTSASDQLDQEQRCHLSLPSQAMSEQSLLYSLLMFSEPLGEETRIWALLNQHASCRAHANRNLRCDCVRTQQ